MDVRDPYFLKILDVPGKRETLSGLQGHSSEDLETERCQTLTRAPKVHIWRPLSIPSETLSPSADRESRDEGVQASALSHVTSSGAGVTRPGSAEEMPESPSKGEQHKTEASFFPARYDGLLGLTAPPMVPTHGSYCHPDCLCHSLIGNMLAGTSTANQSYFPGVPYPTPWPYQSGFPLTPPDLGHQLALSAGQGAAIGGLHPYLPALPPPTSFASSLQYYPGQDNPWITHENRRLHFSARDEDAVAEPSPLTALAFQTRPLWLCVSCKRPFTGPHGLYDRLQDRFTCSSCLWKSAECETCHKRFVSSYVLKRHKRTHAEEKPFACEFCHRRFAAKSAVTRHKCPHLGFSRKRREVHGK